MAGSPHFFDLARFVALSGGADGGTVYFYYTGTTNLAPIWSDLNLTVPMTNPVSIATGQIVPKIFLSKDIVYRRRIIFTSDGSVHDEDPIIGDYPTFSDLVSTTGSGLIGYTPSATYPSSTVGYNLNRFFNFTNSSFSLLTLGSPPANGVYFGAGGNALSFNTLISNPSGGADSDNQRTTALFKAAATDDGNSEEQTVCVLTTIATGYRTTWAASTAYALNANVTNGTNVYRCTTAGTSAGSGGPTGKGSGITDGTAVWLWINDNATDAKVGIYNETLVSPGAGSSWAQANNIQVSSGVLTKVVYNTELDLTNNCGTDSVIGGADKWGLGIFMNGGNVSTAAQNIGSANTSVWGALWGTIYTGTKLASNAVINISASSARGIGIGRGGIATPTFTVAVIDDASIAPAVLSMSGTYSTGAIVDGSTTPYGMKLAGTYSKTPASSSLLPNFANDAAASAGGLSVGDWYRNGSVLMQRVS